MELSCLASEIAQAVVKHSPIQARQTHLENFCLPLKTLD